MHGEAGKGDTYRPVDHKKYGENYEYIFRKQSQPVASCLRCGRGNTPGYEFCIYCGEADFSQVQQPPVHNDLRPERTEPGEPTGSVNGPASE